MSTRAFILLVLSALVPAVGRAQLYVDYGGPRNIFVVPAGGTSKADAKPDAKAGAKPAGKPATEAAAAPAAGADSGGKAPRG